MEKLKAKNREQLKAEVMPIMLREAKAQGYIVNSTEVFKAVKRECRFEIERRQHLAAIWAIVGKKLGLKIVKKGGRRYIQPRLGQANLFNHEVKDAKVVAPNILDDRELDKKEVFKTLQVNHRERIEEGTGFKLVEHTTVEQLHTKRVNEAYQQAYQAVNKLNAVLSLAGLPAVITLTELKTLKNV